MLGCPLILYEYWINELEYVSVVNFVDITVIEAILSTFWAQNCGCFSHVHAFKPFGVIGYSTIER